MIRRHILGQKKKSFSKNIYYIETKNVTKNYFGTGRSVTLLKTVPKTDHFHFLKDI